jgi:hypothetical protein
VLRLSTGAGYRISGLIATGATENPAGADATAFYFDLWTGRSLKKNAINTAIASRLAHNGGPCRFSD